MAAKKGAGELINTGTDKRRVKRDSKGRIRKVEVVDRLIDNPKSTRNSGQPWTAEDEKTLRQLIKENTPTRVIGLKLGRTENGVRAKAKGLSLSLKPVNQPPYNRRKK
jgi:hypothetical protein